MSFDVELTDGAYADLARLTETLAARWPEGSKRMIPKFYAVLPRLESFPLSCGLAYENQFFSREVRHLLFEIRKGRTYRALFTVEGHCVRVLAIRAPGEMDVKPEDVDG